MTEEASGSGLNRPRRYFKHSNPTWLPRSGQRQEAHRARREDNEESGNIVEGLLEIVNMITDNPGLKSDLQEYFENSKRQGKEDKRKINRKKRRERAHDKESSSLDQMIKDYRNLVEEQNAEADLDGEILPSNQEMHGFKKTFSSVDVADSYQELPMELDSDEEENDTPPPPPPPPPPPASDPRLSSYHSKSNLYGEIRNPFYHSAFYHSASAREDWNIPTQTYQYPVFRARPAPAAPIPPPPPPARPPLPSLLPTRPPLPSILPPRPHLPSLLPPTIDLASVPLPLLPPPAPPSPIPPRPAPPITHPPPPPLNSATIPPLKHELIDLSAPEKNSELKEIYFVSSDSSDEGSYCEDSYAEDSVQSEDSLSPEEKRFTKTKKKKPRDVTTPDNDVITVKDEAPSDEEVKSRVSSSESLFSDKDSNSSSSTSSSSSSNKSSVPSENPLETVSENVSETKNTPDIDQEEEEEEKEEKEEKEEEEENKESSEDDEVNSKYNLLDASDEEKVEEDAAALRLKLLKGIKTSKSSVKSHITREINGKSEVEINSGTKSKDDENRVDSEDGKSDSSDSENEEPLVKRQSKRKKCAPTFTFPQVLEMVGELPLIDTDLFAKYYQTKRQQKKARARARKAKIEPLDMLKEELHFDPGEKRWCAVIGPTPAGLYPYSRIARFKLPSAKVENLQNITPMRMDQTLNAIKKRRLERFYQLSEKVQSSKLQTPSNEISPKEIKVTILKQAEDEDISAADKFKSTFKETEDAKQSDTIVGSFSLKSVISKPEKPGDMQSKSNTVKVIQSDDQCKMVAAQSSDSRKSSESRKRSEKSLLEKTAQSVAKLGRSSRKLSEDDLDSMRELLLQSMIRKTREAENPPSKTDVKSNLPVVQIKTKAVPSPRSSPPRIEKQPSPPKPATFKQASSAAAPANESSTQPELPSKKHITKPLPGQSNAKPAINLTTKSLKSQDMTSSRKVTSENVVLGEGIESLMPRALSTITPEAVKRSKEDTRRMISKLLINEDLRVPQKDNKLDPETQAERDKLLKRITPKVAPIVIKLGESESESESDQATTPVKQKVLLSPVSRTVTSDEAQTKYKLNRQRSSLTMKVAQLEQRLVQYTLKRNQQQEEHIKQCERVRVLEKQLTRTRDIVAKSEEILNTIDDRRNACLTELRTRSSALQDLVLRLDDPERWSELDRKRKAAANKPPPAISSAKSSSTCDKENVPKTEGVVANKSEDSEKKSNIKNTQKIPKKATEEVNSEEKRENRETEASELEPGETGASELEPGELASDTSSKPSSSDEESSNHRADTVNTSKDTSDCPEPAPSPVPLLSAESILLYCKSQLSRKPGPEPPSPITKPSTEFAPVPHAVPEINTTSLSKYHSYRSPLVAFRSYRFSPYYRIKCHYSLNSPTFSNKINSSIPICPHDLHGKCFDRACNRQHLSSAMKTSGAQLRTQLCLSAGVSITEVNKFETTHKTLKEEEINILFCDHLNSLRSDRGRDTSYVNTRHIPPSLNSNTRDRSTAEDRISIYNSLQPPPSYTTKYNKYSSRYCTSVSELTLTQQCKSAPKLPENWLDLAACQTSRGAEAGVVIATLSKALQANKNSTELWLEYLRVKSVVISISDLSGLYQQALKLAPSPALWRNFSPHLPSLQQRISALNSALQICDLTKSADKESYGELLKDKLILVHYAGGDVLEQFHTVFQDIDKLLNQHLVWFIQQYICYQQSGTLLEHPDQITISNMPVTGASKVLELREKCVSGVTDPDTLLVLHRLFSKLLVVASSSEQAIEYLFQVSDKAPELYELLEDIVELGGWVEPDVPWPKLVYLQMSAAVKSGHTELALSLSRGLVTTLSGSSAANTLQMFREVLGLTIGARVQPQYACLSRGLHRTWLHMCYSLTASLLPTDPVLQYKMFSTRLATVFPGSEQLNSLRYAISSEPSTQGAHILWTRYLEVLDAASEKDKQLATVLQGEMLHCLRSVPTLSTDNFSFHNQVISGLVSHYTSPQDRFREISHQLLTYRKNKQLLLMYYTELAHSNPLSTIQLFKELLKDNPSCPKLWSKMLELSESCQTVTETREIARNAISRLPLNSSLLLQTLVFELRNCNDATEQKELCNWAISRAQDRGIILQALR